MDFLVLIKDMTMCVSSEMKNGKLDEAVESVSLKSAVERQNSEFGETIEEERRIKKVIKGESRWKPCNQNPEYMNIKMKGGPKIDQLEVIGKNSTCILDFDPKCVFESVPRYYIILKASFPFIRFAKGSNSVEIPFSV
nr:hypothetical transcript [Hymenolepis microstoma]